MSNTLAAPGDLTDFPGAPFVDALVDAAVASLRREVGWHIAPSVDETLTVDASGGHWLMLPTMHLTAVAEVRNVSGDGDPVVITGWRFKRSGMLYRAGGWPHGVGAIEVDVTHGEAETPPELLPVIAERCQVAKRRVDLNSRSLGDLSENYRGEYSEENRRILSMFTIPWSP